MSDPRKTPEAASAPPQPPDQVRGGLSPIKGEGVAAAGPFPGTDPVERRLACLGHAARLLAGQTADHRRVLALAQQLWDWASDPGARFAAETAPKGARPLKDAIGGVDYSHLNTGD